MQPLDLVGHTADLRHLVLLDPTTGERFRLPASAELVRSLVEVLDAADDDGDQDLRRDLADAVGRARGGEAAGGGGVRLDPDAPSAAAALVSLGAVATSGEVSARRIDGSGSRLTPSEIQRLLRAGRTPESVAEQAGVSLEWVRRWHRPIAAEQSKVITSVLNGRQQRDGFGLSGDLIGEAIRTNLLDRGVEMEDDDVEWTATRPEGRPYWTVVLRFEEGQRVRRATWRYDIGTGRVSPRDDLAVDLGWSAPITHPSPGRMHHSGADGAPAPPPPKAAPPPPPTPAGRRWAPPTPPAPRRPR